MSKFNARLFNKLDSSLDRTLDSCLADGTECSDEDFFIFETIFGLCYVLNTGRNSSSHSVDIKGTKKNKLEFPYSACRESEKFPD